MLTNEQRQTIDSAVEILASLYRITDLMVTSPEHVKIFCQLEIGHLEHEVFGVLFLDNRHRLIKFTEMFRGTINGTAVYPREVVKEALNCNAAAVIFTHNHPSGMVEASEADKRLTERLQGAFGYFDIRVLDHIIVSHASTNSFAQSGLL